MWRSAEVRATVPAMAREILDRYYTPDACALECCRYLRDVHRLNPRTILEPSSGMGAFVRAANEIWPAAMVISVDLDPDSTADWPGVDALDLPEDLRVDLVLGNPPYSAALAFVALGLRCLEPSGAVAYLLSSVWQAGTKERKELLLGPLRPTRSVRLMPRPKFRERAGTASVEYDLVVWAPDAGESQVEYVAWR